MSELKIGINEYISNEAYHGDNTRLSSSNVKDVYKKPWLLREKRWGIVRKNPKMQVYFDEGTLAHQIVLEPHLGLEGFIIHDGATWGKKYDELVLNNPEKIIIPKKRYEVILKWVEAVNNHKIASELLKDAIVEQTFCGEVDEVPVKVRLDARKPGMLIDFKTTSSPLIRSDLESTIDNFGYNISLAMYKEVANLFLPEEEKIKDIFLIYVNKKDYDVQVVKLSEKTIKEGSDLFHRGLSKYKKLLAEGYFDKKHNNGIMEI